MPVEIELPLGYATALTVVRLGRAAFFGTAYRDLPVRSSNDLRQDDLTPSFGFVGPEFANRRVLFMGINPGNGARDDRRTDEDTRMMPALRAFASDPSPAAFKRASEAYRQSAVRWPVWQRHCAAILSHGRLRIEEIAYANALPWRTGTKASFDHDVALNAARLFALPLIDELKPTVIIALGKRAAEILSMGDPIDQPLIVWNRAQAATSAVIADREQTARRIMEIVGN